jgi:hypothetical protein
MKKKQVSQLTKSQRAAINRYFSASTGVDVDDD